MTPKDHSYLLLTKPKHLESSDLSDKGFKRTVLREHNEPQENKERKLIEIRRIIHNQNEKFNKEK